MKAKKAYFDFLLSLVIVVSITGLAVTRLIPGELAVAALAGFSAGSLLKPWERFGK